MLNEKQATEIKKQIIQQIDSTFPQDKKEMAKKQVLDMSTDDLEMFLHQNNISIDEMNEDSPKKLGSTQCIFCSISKGEIPSYRIDSNKEALAVLEINPISIGHIIVIPKEHISNSDKIPSSVFSLTKKLSKKVKEKLKPKEVIIYSSKMFDHEILNVLPIYSNENQNSPRKKPSEDDLKKLQSTLETKQKKKVEKVKKQKTKKINSEKEKIWLPRRIP